MWMKARQTDIQVKGEKSLCCVLFMDTVNAVRVVGNSGTKACITERLEELIEAEVDSRKIPVNSCGWHLVYLPEMWSSILVQGCIRLSRVCV